MALEVAGTGRVLPNDAVIILIGTLPVRFLLDMGLELDGVWTRKRFVFALLGLGLGVFVYFFSRHLGRPRPQERACGLAPLPRCRMAALRVLDVVLGWFLPVMWLVLLGLRVLNTRLAAKGRPQLVRMPGPMGCC